MIKKTVSGSGEYTTYYVGPHYEKNATTTVVTKYYTFGSQRVAMRVCTGTNGSCGTNGATSPLTYLHADALGSAALATRVTGTLVSQRRYLPYGETRWSSGTLPTDRRFTGQREESMLVGGPLRGFRPPPATPWPLPLRNGTGNPTTFGYNGVVP